jgi:hypothetical protein
VSLIPLLFFGSIEEAARSRGAEEKRTENKRNHAKTPRRKDFRKKKTAFSQKYHKQKGTPSPAPFSLCPPVQCELRWPHRKVPPRDSSFSFPSPLLGVFASLRDIPSFSALVHGRCTDKTTGN